MATAYSSGTNTFVPSHEASGSLVIGYSRNPSKFKINTYAKMVPVSKDQGYYLSLTAEEAGRVVTSDAREYVWADGQEAPMGNSNSESFQYQSFATKRYAYAFNLGQKAVDMADWKILGFHAANVAQKAMTARTLIAANLLTTSANWGANTGTATALGGGFLDNATSTSLGIKKTWQAVCEQILKGTLATVSRNDIVAVMNPHTAGLLAQAQEVVDLVKQSMFAYDMITQKTPDSPFGNWGLPPELYGVKIVVEDAVRITSKKAGTLAQTYAFPNQMIAFISRPGGIEGMEGVPDFSTIQGFFLEEMTVESRTDPDNRRVEGRVVEDFQYVLAAPASGYLVTAATSS